MDPKIRPNPVKDSQRQKVYNAEASVFTYSPWTRGKTFKSDEEVQAYMDRVTQSKWWKKRWNRYARYNTLRPQRVLLTDNRRGFGHPHAFEYQTIGVCRLYVRIPVKSRNEHVVLHELAHHLAGVRFKHHWQFTAALLELIRNKMGKEIHDKLKGSFRFRRVKHKAPKAKRIYTPEQRMLMSERMAKMRAARKPK